MWTAPTSTTTRPPTTNNNLRSVSGESVERRSSCGQVGKVQVNVDLHSVLSWSNL